MSLFKKRAAKPVKAPEVSGERRHLTILFYDIVGSTSLAERHDPETLRATLDLIHEAARGAVEAHGGSIEQVMGDGGMAYFGYPVASEDAAFSAVHAALDLLETRSKMASAPDIRIGIASSVVVLPDTPDALAGGRLGAVGVAPNLAARLESAAPINGILVSPATYALTHRAVKFQAVDGVTLKGFPDVSQVWRPLALQPVASRFQRDRDSSGTFTGRKDEVAMLKAAWAEAKVGRGSAIVIQGEPGIGKSRMLSELSKTVAAEGAGARSVLLQCQPRTQGEALFSIVAFYERAYEEATDQRLSHAAACTAERLGALEADETLNSQSRREAILNAVVEEILALAADRPLLVMGEDLHWADEVTFAVLDRLAKSVSKYPLLMIGTSRPVAGLDNQNTSFTLLPLSPIAREDAYALIDDAARMPLAQKTKKWIVERADGNPLFLTELTAFAVEAMAAGKKLSDINGAQVASLSDLLETRLESSGVAKRTAQIASVVGRESSYYLLTKLATDYDKQSLDADLQRLVDHGLNDIIDNGYAYAFRHVLIRDVAYDSQLRTVRQELHGKIVDLVDADATLSESVPNILLAEHCLAADRTQRGAELLLQVAEDAIRRSALQAPYRMLERVLTLAGTLAPSMARDLIQLQAITLLGPLVTLLDGPRTAASLYERGQALYFSLPETERDAFFPVLWGWWFTASNLVEQTRRSEVLIRDVTPRADPESRLQALHCGWATLFDGGAHDRCLATIADGLALYEPQVGHRSRYVYGHDARVCGLGERALSSWLTGQVHASAEAIEQCEAWADETAHLSSCLHGLDIASQVAFFRHDLNEIDRILNKMTELADVDAVPAIVAKRKIFRGWMAASRGDRGQIEAVTQGLAALREFGVLEDVPFYADIAAEVAAASGSADAALGPLCEAIEESRNTGLTYWLPELLRRKAVLSSKDLAEAALDEGFEIAATQNARMLAMRNIASRLDLGMAIPADQAAQMATKIAQVDECALRKKVVHALGL
ncbi:AAA family ATPase [Sulfitobacter sp. F26204]|uniref:ATP-binding protein n=1 Tax=Sulfitobacter sp. F26204 TaxID=2996014 RepID=UPI00225E0949|nr:AAA family ATPase [Sulfitobacter sp. F26204]MCX7559237.1 AAA family ATPase [Sulfitobacter sp. F26204]